MRRVRRELDFLQREMQRDRGLLRALRRHSRRMHGKEMVHSSSAFDDAERIRDACGDVPDTPAGVQSTIDLVARNLEAKKARRAELQHRLDTQLPITPWGVAFALIRAWYRQIRT